MMHRDSSTTRVLISGVCHPIAADTLHSLRRISQDTIHIVGVDLAERRDNYDGVDAYHVVPPADAPDYVDTLLEICRSEGVEVVVPWSDLEVDVISSHVGAFRDVGVAPLCGSYESVRRTLDKFSTLQALQEAGVPVSDFEAVSTVAEVEGAAVRLGYPSEKVVVKPRRASGGRGMWILDPDASMLEHHSDSGRPVTLPVFLFMLQESERNGRDIPGYVVTRYLAGDDYSVDALASGGEAIYVVPRRRIKAVEGISHVGEIVSNPEVRAVVVDVIRALKLHLNVNVQLKYSRVSGGTPHVYEVNPRISGSIVVNDGVGAALLYCGIQLALGREVPPAESVELRGAWMYRRWVATFKDSGERFSP